MYICRGTSRSHPTQDRHPQGAYVPAHGSVAPPRPENSARAPSAPLGGRPPPLPPHLAPPATPGLRRGGVPRARLSTPSRRPPLRHSPARTRKRRQADSLFLDDFFFFLKIQSENTCTNHTFTLTPPIDGFYILHPSNTQHTRSPPTFPLSPSAAPFQHRQIKSLFQHQMKSLE